ncbi:MAG: hypothetical protein OXI43_19955 [Candidatus Poribacteria bacterium]|nr:hypothetical protein [Candidatus Poribacteria bacterium]
MPILKNFGVLTRNIRKPAKHFGHVPPDVMMRVLGGWFAGIASLNFRVNMGQDAILVPINSQIG